ncbi:phosphotransferase [Taklimakanibacter deserti]|uniref:phosphotransferase n=1 Tax=Taklimakanibacter deserti TaxID=2267839 RepID=UPI000E64BD49
MTASSRIAALPFWKGRPVLTPIESGRTNRNYRVEDRGRCYFARSGEDIPHLGILRSAERRSAELAAHAGLAPRIRYAEDGVLITDFISGTTLDQAAAGSSDMRARIARHLHALHGIPAADDLPLFCPVTISLFYLASLDDVSLPFARARLRRCLEDLPRAQARCLVHGDLIPENFIVTPTGKLQLIDWEYAGNGEPEIDIALIASNFDLTGGELGDFISAYGHADRAAVSRYRIAAAIREALWCLVQLRHGEAGADLEDYARKCIARAATVLE